MAGSTGRKEWIKRERKDNGIRKRIDICCGLAMQKKRRGCDGSGVGV